MMRSSTAITLLAVLFGNAPLIASKRFSESKVLELLAKGEDAQENSTRSGGEKEAFEKNYLIGFSLEKVTFTDNMAYAGPDILTRLKSGMNQPKWYTLTVGDRTFYAGQAVQVTRKEIVPVATTDDVALTRAKKLKALEVGTSAMYYAYVRFARTTDESKVIDQHVVTKEQAGPSAKAQYKQREGLFRFGGFVYFASAEHLKKGLPMKTMNILSKAAAGTMRFKNGYSTFWQIRVPKWKGASSRQVDFPPDISKAIELCSQNGETTCPLSIHKTATYAWFGKVFPLPEAPLFHDVVCTLKGTSKMATGTCQFTNLDKDDLKSLNLSAKTAYTASIKPTSQVLPAAGRPGDRQSRWWPITRPDFIEAGVTHYTWVQPGEMRSVGGFLYYMEAEDKIFEHGSMKFFEMMPLLCRETEGGTAYDEWQQKFIAGARYQTMKEDVLTLAGPKPVQVVDAAMGHKKMKTLVFVIDMQNDFVSMSFQQPCKFVRMKLMENLGKFLRAQHEKQATIVASLDYHPKHHCGLLHNCANENMPSAEYAEAADEDVKSLVADELYYQGENATTERYKNTFPPHCEYLFNEEGLSVPSEGAKFAKEMSQLFRELSGKGNKVHTVFKAFHPAKDSFSALPTLDKDGNHEEFTGGFALSLSAAAEGGNHTLSPSEYKPWPEDCYETLTEENVPIEASKTCYPNKEQLANPTAEGNSMWSVVKVIKALDEKEHFDRIIVTGLVFDFCVKETAFNAVSLFPGKQVIVPLELAHPACEGGPVPDFAYKPAGLGTTPIIERTEKEYAARGIKLVKMCDIDPSLCE